MQSTTSVYVIVTQLQLFCLRGSVAILTVQTLTKKRLSEMCQAVRGRTHQE
ncbi:hypothetical protein HRE53_31755 (plasmid) [Acaryochloris sp. 'Moss Beach']|uniref:hypothetical protein n=1 Tax=Acaryochloris sp. 'Moss Beach' TaxID=2740837 RepID=UPI001F1AA2A4|nr:hypothetical protein [Acaryochloris sp. 'Moss Beach']UJB73265.1 hypothetical protein HRE53_31755 [Acaryochloris sp. 'Moss Beach']